MKMSCLCCSLVLLFSSLAFGEPPAVDTAPTLEDVKKELSEVMDAIRAYSSHRQAEALKSMESALEKMDREINMLGDRMRREWEKMEPDVRQKAQETLDHLDSLRDRMAKSLEEWKSGGEITWNAIKEDFLNTWEEFRKSFDDADRQYARPTVYL